MKKIFALLLCLALLPACVSCGPTAAPVETATPAPAGIQMLSEKDGGVVDLCDEVITTYWNMDVEESLDYVRENCYKKTREAHDGQTLTLLWEGGVAPYTVTVGRTDGETLTFETETARLCPGVLYPGASYTWSVTDSQGTTSGTGRFITAEGPRIISTRLRMDAHGVRNFRDMGGYPAQDGKHVRYDMLFRGGMLLYPNDKFGNYQRDTMDDFGAEVIASLGIRTELDLRGDSDYGGQETGAFPDWTYVRETFKPYTAIFPDDVYVDSAFYDSQAPAALALAFSYLSDEENYPVYFHCMVGQDRTGTLAYLLYGLLGVSYEDILRDYELSAFSSVGSMDRAKEFYFTGDRVPAGTHPLQDAAFTTMHETMLRCYGTESGTLQDAVENYLTTVCGVTPEQIETIRSLLLE